MFFGLIGVVFGDCLGLPTPNEPRWDSWRWDSDERWDSGGEFYSGPTELDALSWDCDATDWWYDVYSVGWMTSPDLFIYQTGSDEPWDEAQPFPSESYDFDPDGWWDNFYLELSIVTTPGDVVLGETTLYACEDARKASLTWHLILYDMDGVEADCAVWGDDPDSLGTECEEL